MPMLSSYCKTTGRRPKGSQNRGDPYTDPQIKWMITCRSAWCDRWGLTQLHMQFPSTYLP